MERQGPEGPRLKEKKEPETGLVTQSEEPKYLSYRKELPTGLPQAMRMKVSVEWLKALISR